MFKRFHLCVLVLFLLTTANAQPPKTTALEPPIFLPDEPFWTFAFNAAPARPNRCYQRRPTSLGDARCLWKEALSGGSESLAKLDKALRIFQASGDAESVALIRIDKAALLYRQSDYLAVTATLVPARQHFTETNNISQLVRCLSLERLAATGQLREYNRASALKLQFTTNSNSKDVSLMGEILNDTPRDKISSILSDWVNLFDASQEYSQTHSAESENAWKDLAEAANTNPAVRALAWLGLAYVTGEKSTDHEPDLNRAAIFSSEARRTFAAANWPLGVAQADLLDETFSYASGNLEKGREIANRARTAFEQQGSWNGVIEAEVIRAAGEKSAGQRQKAIEATAEAERLEKLHLSMKEGLWAISDTTLTTLINEIHSIPEIRRSTTERSQSTTRIRAFYAWSRQIGHPYLELVALRSLSESLVAEGQWNSGVFYTLQAQDLYQRLQNTFSLRRLLAEAARLDYQILGRLGLRNEPTIATNYSAEAAQLRSFVESLLPALLKHADGFDEDDKKDMQNLLSSITVLAEETDRERLAALELLAKGDRTASAKKLDVFFEDLAKLLKAMEEAGSHAGDQTKQKRNAYSAETLAYIHALDKAVVLSDQRQLFVEVDRFAVPTDLIGRVTTIETSLPVTLGGIFPGAAVGTDEPSEPQVNRDWTEDVDRRLMEISNVLNETDSLKGTRWGNLISTLAKTGVQEGISVMLLGGTPEESAASESVLFRSLYATQIACSLAKPSETDFLEIPGTHGAGNLVTALKANKDALKWAGVMGDFNAMVWIQSLRSLPINEMRNKPALQEKLEAFMLYGLNSVERLDDWDDDDEQKSSILKDFSFGSWISRYPALLMVLAGQTTQAASLAVLMRSAQTDIDHARLQQWSSPLSNASRDFFTIRRELAFNLAIYYMASAQYEDAVRQLSRLVTELPKRGEVETYQYYYALALCYRRLKRPEAELRSLSTAIEWSQGLHKSMPTRNLALQAQTIRQVLVEEYLGVLYRNGKYREMASAIWRYRRPTAVPVAVVRTTSNDDLADLTTLTDLYGALSSGNLDSPVTAADIRSTLAIFTFVSKPISFSEALSSKGQPAPELTLRPGHPSLNGIDLAASMLVDEMIFSRSLHASPVIMHSVTQSSVFPVIEKGELLINYFVGTHGVFIVTVDEHGETQAHYRRVDYSRIDYLCKHFREALAGDQSIDQTAREIYGLVLGFVPEMAGKNHLRILADGPLELIPFQALRSSPAEPFLIERYTVSYAFGPSEATRLPDKSRRPRVLVVADPTGDLKSSETEARAIEEASFPPKLSPLLGSNATIATLRKYLPKAEIVHFSSHAELNENQPNFSFLMLAGSDRIYSLDLAALDFRAKHVFLAGCETLLAEPALGDDIYGLADAFVGAGSTSVIATLWRIEQEASARFGAVFYENSKNNKSGPQVLANTQRLFISKREGSEFARPVSWAAFNYLAPLQFTNAYQGSVAVSATRVCERSVRKLPKC